MVHNSLRKQCIPHLLTVAAVVVACWHLCKRASKEIFASVTDFDC